MCREHKWFVIWRNKAKHKQTEQHTQLIRLNFSPIIYNLATKSNNQLIFQKFLPLTVKVNCVFEDVVPSLTVKVIVYVPAVGGELTVNVYVPAAPLEALNTKLAFGNEPVLDELALNNKVARLPATVKLNAAVDLDTVVV